MEKSQPPRKIFFSEKNITLIIRWWAVGAVYFFIGWGTNLGQQQTLIDFVLVLGLVIGMFNILILNRLLRMMFNIGPHRPKGEDTVAQRISDYLVELIKNVLIVWGVAMIYSGLNAAWINFRSLPPDSVPIPGEPIMFGVFYILILILIDFLVNGIKTMVANRRAGSV